MKPDSIIAGISNYQPQTGTETPLSAAVILFLMLDATENFYLIVTKRPDTIATYAGDYCFPGGAKEIHDLDLKITAMREAEEELGIKPQYYRIIGQLDDFSDHYGNQVRPFVALISKQDFEKNHNSSAEEIAEIYYFPLEDLKKISVDQVLDKVLNRHPAYVYRHDNVFIWGLTATIMVHLAKIIYK